MNGALADNFRMNIETMLYRFEIYSMIERLFKACKGIINFRQITINLDVTIVNGNWYYNVLLLQGDYFFILIYIQTNQQYKLIAVCTYVISILNNTTATVTSLSLAFTELTR